MDKEKWKILGSDLKTAVTIEHMKKDGNIPHFSSLIKETELDTTTLHIALDNLIDIGVIDTKWTKIENKWVREFFIDEHNKDFIQNLVKEIWY